METPRTLLEAIKHFSNHENCRQFMVAIRWSDGVVKCPHCGSAKVTYLAKARVYQCYGKHAKSKFSLKVGTIFEDSPIGLDKWLPAAWLLSNCKNGISSYEVARALGITQKSAWHMLHRLREAISVEPFHLDAYVKEQVFRYNNRTDADDFARFATCMMGIQGKRLTYQALTQRPSLV